MVCDRAGPELTLISSCQDNLQEKVNVKPCRGFGDNCFDVKSKGVNPVPSQENLLIFQGCKEKELRRAGSKIQGALLCTLCQVII